MELYKELPKGLYLGRMEKTDQHLVLSPTGEVKLFQTVKPIPMAIDERLKIIQYFNKHEQASSDKPVYEETGIDPRPTSATIVANRSVGGKTRFNKLSEKEKQKAFEEFGPRTKTMKIIPEHGNLESECNSNEKISSESNKRDSVNLETNLDANERVTPNKVKRLIENLESKIKANDRSIPKVHTENINLESRKREN